LSDSVGSSGAGVLAFSVEENSADVADFALLTVSLDAFQAPGRFASGTLSILDNV
jgi:hypothetical protein